MDHNLAKVGVVGSNPIARSKICCYCKNLRAYGAPGPFSFWLRKHLGSTAIPILPPLGMSRRKQNKAGLRIAAKAGLERAHVTR